MMQQMDIIKGYIRKAKQERRFEEVALFEQNLKDLELDYMRQRQGRWLFSVKCWLLVVCKEVARKLFTFMVGILIL